MALQEDARSAVRQIGTNAIPYLLNMLRETDTALQIKLLELAKKQKFIRIHSKPAWVRNNEAAYGFEILGAEAKHAVPALAEIFEQDLSPSSQSSVADALAGIGPDASAAVSSLLRGATNSDTSVRVHAVYALSQIHPPSELAVPALISYLSDPSFGVRVIAARGLGKYGPEARQAVPALVKLLNDKEKGVQRAAAYAIKQIDPEAATNADLK